MDSFSTATPKITTQLDAQKSKIRKLADADRNNKVLTVMADRAATVSIDDIHENVDAYLQYMLGVQLLYVSLVVTRLSDAMEAHFVGLCSIQVVMDSRRVRKATSTIRDFIAINSFVFSAVFGIAMLNSFHALNVLNIVYGTAGIVLINTAYLLGELKPENGFKVFFGTVISSLHFAFVVVTFLVAGCLDV